ncbi:HD-GYP domain-containing protein [Catellatospora coxensis]
MADRIDRALGDQQCAAAVSRWAFRTASRLGLDEATQRRTAAAARVHDIGRITSLAAHQPDEPRGVGRAEDLGHPAQGARLLVELAGRPDLAQLVAAHHERHDGAGYPYGLAGSDIPVGARIIAVCDAWAVLRSGDPGPPGRRRRTVATNWPGAGHPIRPCGPGRVPVPARRRRARRPGAFHRAGCRAARRAGLRRRRNRAAHSASLSPAARGRRYEPVRPAAAAA